MKGWIIDVDADNSKNCIVVWIKGENGSVEKFERNFFPSFYVYSSQANLRGLEQIFVDNPAINSLEYEEKSLWLGEPAKEVLKISLQDYGMLMEVAKEIDEMGEFCKYELFNVDLSIPFAFVLEKDIIPMTFIECKNESDFEFEFELLEDPNSIDYSILELRSAELDVEIETDGIPTPDDPISKIVLDDVVIEEKGEDEKLLQLVKEIRNSDPDILYTNNGDSFLLPYLYYRAKVNEIEDFFLGRDRDLKPVGKGRSYFSYGRIIYKPPRCVLNGRVHIDRNNSFIYRESGIHGLIELSRLARIPLQTLSRVTPGTVISTIQIAQAIRENVLVRWKKNVPEDFKDAKTLFLADRGGMIYEPKTGIHENVVEIDFTSLYPAIMVKHNISPETILCKCCTDSKHRAPIIDYNICERRIGLIPRVLEPLINRRIEYKKRVKDKGYSEFREIYDARKKALKWILVTCFGYTGYRNARFGRIECHEVINAYGRELLLNTAKIAEELGYEVLHGIVDSLWLKSSSNNSNNHEKLCEKIFEQIGISVEIEGIYKWIVFLPRRSDHTGALNRYYGLFEKGDMKIRGLELRRSDTSPLIKGAQMDMLKVMARANDIVELQELIPDVIEVVRGYADMVMNGKCDLKDLVFTSVVSKDLEYYHQLNNNLACMLQLKDEGLKVRPGEQVKYIITDAESKRYSRKVKAWQLAKGNERLLYDKKKYLAHLVSAAESILSPFGYTERKLADIVRPVRQLTLTQ
jgi:DNA polymerase elongation subunit (family B)